MKWLLPLALAAFLGTMVGGQASAADEASIVRGGRLYDHWGAELGERLPSAAHPLFTARRGAGADTWRCAECHGWDYKGNHGIVGIRGRQGGDPAAIVAVLKNATHRYGGLMAEQDLLDLATFVSHGQVDMPTVIEAARRTGTDAAGHEKYYGTICASCHGADGTRLRELRPLGDLARWQPTAVLHVILNGHPGRGMPALRVLGAEFSARMLAYLQTLPSQSLAVSIAHGGRLYDNWQVETGAARPALPHPAYPANAFYAADAPLTWRCKSCHGWDYLGSQGAYASGHHATGIKGIRDLAGSDPARVAAILRDSTHRFDAVLKERELQDLANFVSHGQVDMNAAIDRQSGRARGNAKRAGSYFRTICANCHGLDGRRIVTTWPLGSIARSRPWESLHKILNGHPDEKMPALRELDQQLLIDILAYLQELPENRGADGN